MKKLKLRNKLIIINLLIFALVFFCQFIFQNVFFDVYYKKHQTQVLNKKLKQFQSALNDKNLTDHRLYELSDNSKILLVYLNKQLQPIAGNLLTENTITVETDDKKQLTLTIQSNPMDNDILQIGSRIEADVLQMMDNEKFYIESMKIDNQYVERSFIMDSRVYITDNIEDMDILDEIRAETFHVTGKVIQFTNNRNISMNHQMLLWNMIMNNQSLGFAKGTQVLDGENGKYLITVEDANEGYLIASISMNQSKEIIALLNNFNQYIIIFTIIMVILVVINYSKTIIQPILQMKKGAQAIANQDFSQHITIHSRDELEELGDALNSISINLENKIKVLEDFNDKLKQEYEERLEIEKNQKNLLMNISHDLKTPLTIIKGYLKAIKDGIYDKEDHMDYVIESVDEISHTLNEMLELTKFNSKSYHLSLEQTDLTRMIYKTYNNIVHLSREKNQKVELDLLDDVFVTIDKNAMKKVLENLCMNAIQYSPQHEKIMLRLCEVEEGFKFTIENQGISIPQKELKHVFDPFYRVDKSRNDQIKGNGLGLGIVKIILDNHHLNYYMHNTEEGVAFTIMFKSDGS